MVTIRSRGRLPHWEANNAVYFVTFRLADSLPEKVLRAFEFERQDIIRTAQAMDRELSPHERNRLAELFSDTIEAHLDAGTGSCWLGNAEVARTMVHALRHFDGIRYDVFAWCVMPNHVHVVFRPVGKQGLSEVLHTWKSYSAKRANQLLGRSGAFWQHEYYDHLIRDEAEFNRMVDYVLKNPQKAGLQGWPWVGKNFDE